MAGIVNNRQMAAILFEVADLLEIKDVKFKPVAYRRAAHGIETLAEDIGRVAERNGLEELPGVGTHIATKLKEILETGKLRYLEQLKQEMGPGIRELADVGGIGPKKAMVLHRELGIESMDQLESAARDGKIRGLFGFGEKSEHNILQSITYRKGTTGRFLLGTMVPVAEKIRSTLASLPAVRQISLAGSIRRMKETIGDIDILVASPEPESVMAAFTSLSEVSRVLGRGTTKSSIVMESGVQVDLRVVEEGQYGTSLQYFTGSKDHNIALRRRALDRGWSLSEYGVKEEETGKNLTGLNEEELYRMLGLSYIEPELRENTGEIEAAENGMLPRIVPYPAVRGDLHIHTDWSDGRDSIHDMAAAARGLGYEYIAICDHFRIPGINRGLSKERIAEQREEIDQLNSESDGFFVLHGIECTINPEGTLDLSPEILKDFDLVIASIHSQMRMHGDEMTHRVLAALQNEHVDILGHPTGRILLQHEPSELDLPAIFRTAADRQVALEINGHPSRLDLSDMNCRKAKGYGVNFSIGSDAHAGSEMQEIRFGIATARRGWLVEEEVINTWPLSRLRAWLGN
jgi:DNA polymerase (family 10)